MSRKSQAKLSLSFFRIPTTFRKRCGSPRAKWLIVEEHVSVPVDLNTMKPDPLSKP
jgi:hypothetical protein